MTGREFLRLGGALLLGAALAFPAALWLAGPGQADRPPQHRPPADRREMFSPDVRGDPYVQEQLRQQVEILEAHCRRTGEMCREAAGARRRLDDLTRG